ncbi:putative serine protease K12H4.7 [Eurosta solidaginis]|uniref:putative serine protease K12H4.7 n=1 Tax=Eurosta solidaginis TaxID=178769 RepID=UPI0035309CE8
MKSFQQVLLFLLVLGLAALTVTAKINLAKLRQKFISATKANSTLFVRSLDYLHREPPFGEATNRYVKDDMWIEQKLDHFNESNTETWQMRYLMNDQYYQEGGPIFIFVGGEWAISAGGITRGHLVDLAAEHKGILYYTEHRYYGKSKPTNDLTIPNLKYLNAKEALADLAHFIKYQRHNTPGLANSKVIMAGGSYSASLVVWFKRLYPELLAGGFASSAPILAKIDFKEYKEVCGRAILEFGGQKCYDRVEKGVAELEAMIEQGRTAEIKAMMQLCDTFDENNDLDLWSLFSTISNLFAAIIQYQQGDDVPIICDYLLEADNDVVAIAKFFLLFVDNACIDVSYKGTLAYYIDSTYTGGANRPWFYQTCNEFGWYQTSSSRNQPFGTKFPLTLNNVLCEDVFGPEHTNSKLTAKVAQINLDFGGLTPNVTNVYQTHGSLDPWSALGHTAADGATILSSESHCSDFNSISKDDSAEVRASKEKLAELVREWLAN